MIKADQIPDEVVEAVAKVISQHDGWGFNWTAYEETARASIASALNAWPGMFHHPVRPDEEACIFLPVDQDSTRTAS